MRLREQIPWSAQMALAQIDGEPFSGVFSRPCGPGPRHGDLLADPAGATVCQGRVGAARRPRPCLTAQIAPVGLPWRPLQAPGLGPGLRARPQSAHLG